MNQTSVTVYGYKFSSSSMAVIKHGAVLPEPALTLLLHPGSFCVVCVCVTVCVCNQTTQKLPQCCCQV